MDATLTLCSSKKMLSSVRVLPMPFAFHCSMLNGLSDMEGVQLVLGGGKCAHGCGKCAHGCGGVLQAVQI